MKNKNKPDEELKKIKGKYYYSESEKTFYEIDGDTQKPIEDKKKLKDEVFDGMKKSGEWFKQIFEVKDSNDESAFPFI